MACKEVRALPRALGRRRAPANPSLHLTRLGKSWVAGTGKTRLSQSEKP